MLDIYNNLGVKNTVAPATYTASATGTGIDLQGHESALIVIDAGAYTDGSHTFEVQESDDNTNFTAVVNSDLQGTEPVIDASADASQVYKVGYVGIKRYIRVVATVSGTTSGASYGASVVLGNSRKRP